MRKFVCLIFTLLISFSTNAAELKVVTTVKPVNSIITNLSKGVFKPKNLIDAEISPHHFQLKPSQVADIHDCDLIIWVGENLESGLTKAINQKSHGKAIKLSSIPEIKLLNLRNKHSCSHAHEHEHKGDDSEEESTNSYDPHIWLSIKNAKIIAKSILEELIKLDPSNKNAYKGNAKLFLQKLDKLEHKLAKNLKDKKAPFMVLHDSLQYLEKEFDLNGKGSIFINPEVQASAKRISELKDKIETESIKCIFAEPQLNTSILSIFDEQNLKFGVVDPLGVSLKDNSELYFILMIDLSKSISSCLTNKSQDSPYE